MPYRSFAIGIVFCAAVAWLFGTNGDLHSPKAFTAQTLPPSIESGYDLNLLDQSFLDGEVDESGLRWDRIGSTSAEIFEALPKANTQGPTGEHPWAFVLPYAPNSSSTVLVSTYQVAQLAYDKNGKESIAQAINRLYSYDFVTNNLLLIYQEVTTPGVSYPDAPHYWVIGRDGSHLIAIKTRDDAVGAPCGGYYWYSQQRQLVALDLANLRGGWQPYTPPDDLVARDARRTLECEEEVRMGE